MARLIKFGLSIMPWLIIAGLLWAGIFIKPKPAGSTVEPPVIERQDAFFGIVSPEPKQLWVAGNNGKIIHSADDGANWIAQKVTGAPHLQDIAAWDAKHLVAVGNGGMVFTTDDGGTHWQGQNIGFLRVGLNKLLRIKAFPGGQAWAVGEMGALLQSGDFGKTWERRRDEQDTAFNDVLMISDKQGWVVGEAGSMLRTVDGGRNWDALTPIVRSSLMAVAFRDAQNGVAVGLEGVILVTHDAGKTWNQFAATRKGSADVAMKLHFYDVVWDAGRNRWFAVGDQGIQASADAGAAVWEGGKLQPQESAWHTRIASAHGNFYLAGATIGEWAGKDDSWRGFRSSN
jgi:photosystem II stability/assembly factor-like uncharacterized protein